MYRLTPRLTPRGHDESDFKQKLVDALASGRPEKLRSLRSGAAWLNALTMLASTLVLQVREHNRPRDRRILQRDERPGDAIEKRSADGLDVAEVKAHEKLAAPHARPQGCTGAVEKSPQMGIELATEEDEEEECSAVWSYPPESTPSTELFRRPA